MIKSFHQRMHLFSTFILLVLEQLKARKNGGLFCNGPNTLKFAGLVQFSEKGGMFFDLPVRVFQHLFKKVSSPVFRTPCSRKRDKE